MKKAHAKRGLFSVFTMSPIGGGAPIYWGGGGFQNFLLPPALGGVLPPKGDVKIVYEDFFGGLGTNAS
jgi:hypothetical protein